MKICDICKEDDNDLLSSTILNSSQSFVRKINISVFLPISPIKESIFITNAFDIVNSSTHLSD